MPLLKENPEEFKKLRRVFLNHLCDGLPSQIATDIAIELAREAYYAGYARRAPSFIQNIGGRTGVMTQAPNFYQWIKEVEEAIQP